MLALSMSIIWHLSQEPLEKCEAYAIMDIYEDPEDCLQLCDLVLPELPSIEGKLCLAQYIVDRDFSHDKKYHYFNMALGLKMLSALKSPKREGYIDLIAHPYLLLEQMLMNVELKDAELSLKSVQDMLANQNDVIPVLNLSSVNILVEDYASKALEVHFLDALLDYSSSSIIVLSTEETLVSDEPFMMPARVPTKEEWVPDAKISRCQVCKEERFNMFSRRHHCRRCGRVVCANCSQHTLIVEGYGNIKVRVCDDCYNVMTGSLSLTTASFEKRYRVLSSMRSSPRNSPFQTGETPNSRRRASSISSGQPAFRWVLSSDSEQNATVRNEFSYEQTPSISLCYSILKLHTDERKCAQFLMNLSDRLLGKIKMRRSGKMPLEIDYSLIISMMKSLLMNAKVKCHQVQDHEGEALAEVYFQHLDIIKLLVNANCRHLIPKEIVTDTEKRGKKKMEMLPTENRLPSDSINRFVVLNDKNDQKKESPLLHKILKVLEDSKYPGAEKASTIFKSLSSLRNIKSGLSQFEEQVSPLNDLIKKECMFYLSTYGTHFSTVSFFRKHGLLNEALDYILEEKCEPDVFVEALFIPALKNVQLSSLKYLMTSTDPALSKWSSYLFATCRHLERIKFLNVLYEIQMFMEDYARAAKSAINFYLSPAPSYESMFERQRHLHNARKHYELYLQYTKNTDAVSESWKRRKFIKAMSVKEIESYLQVISVQEEVSKFLKLCASRGFLYEVGEEKCPPTLFGNAQRKSELLLMVLVNSVNVDEGFEIALKLLKVFSLDTTAILCKAGSGEVEDIIKMLTSDSNKINAYLICGKLKSAYLLAVKLSSALDVRRIMIAAEQCEQDSIQRHCRKWLETNVHKLKPKDPSLFQ
ncbi:hypothetical protein JTE90_022222 [Oedothorax gibbosus]|uniref:FYVE-type domain-containing protein n=1 Tax=Oedothorax gibbosus TaxID=931172 RepID=A0AAV6UC11_9ARAC|nr:hypothetical protein JTE90_022222 [Oedothorax gibbosus]